MGLRYPHFVALTVTTIALALAGCSTQGAAAADGGKAKKGVGIVPVVVGMVSTRNVPMEIQVIGNVEAYSTINVVAQVSGQLIEAGFKEGDYVKKNDLLFKIDPRPYEAAIQQAEANIERDKAMLAQAEANLSRDMAQEKYAKSNAGRYKELVTEGIVSKDQSEQIESNADAIGQAVAADRAAIQSARANIGASNAALETAKVNLSYTTITSPIDGRTGNLTVKQGNVVTANVTNLISINEVEPIYVTFAIPENHLPEVKAVMGQGQQLEVFATPQGDDSVKAEGRLTFIDNNVDTTTGTIKLKGTFNNKDRKLWPGEFVRVTLRLATQANAMVVPNQAVQTGQNGPFVYVVKDDQTVEPRPVVTGARVDQDLVVNKGLAVGEMIVLEGQLRLAPGMKVKWDGQKKRPA
ncbi:MAG TPA: efflux RND transporter periplasmic adaptor subunit [Bryobacteraceae bacterium]|jgi:multidrug efflux system membrane fusion protein